MIFLTGMSAGEAGITAILGYLVVFFGLVLLMCVVIIMGKIMARGAAKPAPVAVAEAESSAPPKSEPAPGCAGELKLYDTEPRDAAMIMAIVADSLGKPVNELRFKSIKEVREDEV